jgi:hypothetical protein
MTRAASPEQVGAVDTAVADTTVAHTPGASRRLPTPTTKRVDKRVAKMAVQLERWSARIDELAAKTENAGTRATIVEHQRVDELRVCRAIARARFEEYRSAGEEQRESLKGGMQQAWNDLAAAVKKLKGRNTR